MDDAEELPPYIVPLCLEEPVILYEDEHLLLVNKPAFLLTVPGRHRLNKDCLITRLQQHYPTATVVHRLDLDTSGILIIPLSKPVHSHISRQFQERQVDKSYTAELFGIIEQDGEINLPISADWERRPKQKIDIENGKNALTRYEVIETDLALNKTRVIFRPTTGRSHQLRIHSAAIHHPILGCDMYAHEEALAASPRLQLHATSLGFVHPVTNQWLECVSPSPF